MSRSHVLARVQRSSSSRFLAAAPPPSPSLVDACAAPARAPHPPHGAHMSLPSFHATDTGRALYNLISGTIPNDVGQMTELNNLCVSLLLPAPRPRARCAASQPFSGPLLTALRSRPSRASFAHRALPSSHSFRAHIRRTLHNNKISGTIPNAIGLLTKLNTLYVSLLLPAPRPRAAPPRSLLARAALRSRPSHASFAHHALPPSQSFCAHMHRVLSYNQITGASAGICAIKGQIYPDDCLLSPNPDWTNGAMCPTCLNTGNCKPPVTCTNTSF